MQLMSYSYPSIHLAKTPLFVSLVNEVLQSKVYAAKEVGYSYSLSPSPNGLSLSFSGLSDPAIFRKFINTVAGSESLSVMFLCEHDCKCESFSVLSTYQYTLVSTALTDTTTLRGSYNFFHVANDTVTEYLRNYNLTTLPYHYYQYIQS